MPESTTEDTLCPCPFCGKTEGHRLKTPNGNDDSAAWVFGKCGVVLGPFPTKALALAAWNTRAVIQPPPKLEYTVAFTLPNPSGGSYYKHMEDYSLEEATSLLDQLLGNPGDRTNLRLVCRTARIEAVPAGPWIDPETGEPIA